MEKYNFDQNSTPKIQLKHYFLHVITILQYKHPVTRLIALVLQELLPQVDHGIGRNVSNFLATGARCTIQMIYAVDITTAIDAVGIRVIYIRVIKMIIIYGVGCDDFVPHR
jgi:hypothetical protein